MIVVHKTCIGCGACASIAPEAFELLDTVDGYYSIPKIRNIKYSENIQDAIDACPVTAIENRVFRCGYPTMTRQKLEDAILSMKLKLVSLKKGDIEYSSEDTRKIAENSLMEAIAESEHFKTTHTMRDK